MTFSFCSKFFFAVLVISMGSGLQGGYTVLILYYSGDIMRNWISQIMADRVNGTLPTRDEVELVTNTMHRMFPIGAILGGILTHHFAEKCTRKWGLFWNNIISLWAVGLIVWSKYAQTYELFIIGKFVAGVNSALNDGIVQIYLIEISPDHIRGAVGSSFLLFIRMSMLLGLVCAASVYQGSNWHLLFLVEIIPAVFQLIGLLFCPHSPKQLLKAHDGDAKTEQALIWLRGTTSIDSEMEEIKQEDNMVTKFRAVTLKRMFNDVQLRTPLVICMILQAGSELCGINCILAFSFTALQDMGFSESEQRIILLIIYTLNLVTIIINILLVDYVGRRALLMMSFMGMTVATSVLTVALILAGNDIAKDVTKYIAVVSLLLVGIAFHLGVGPIVHFITAEMFNHSTRALAVSITVSVKWVFSIIIVETFMPLQNIIDYYIFTAFIALNIFFCLMVLLRLQETAKLSARGIMMLNSYLI